MCNKVPVGVASRCNAVGIWWGVLYVVLTDRESRQRDRQRDRECTMNILFEKENNA